MKVQQQQMLVVGPGEGRSIELGRGLGVDFKIWGHQTGGRFSIVEHPIEARRLVPPHTHTMEDELSYVLEGRVGVRIGDEVAEAGPGTYIYKPCGVPHTFWNPTDQPAACWSSFAQPASRITSSRFQSYSRRARKRAVRSMRQSRPVITNRISWTGCQS